MAENTLEKIWAEHIAGEFVTKDVEATLATMVKDDLWARYSSLAPERLAEDEKFWRTIRRQYRLTPDYINLENGYY